MYIVPDKTVYTIGVDTNITFTVQAIDLESGIEIVIFNLANAMNINKFATESDVQMYLVSGDKYNGTWQYMWEISPVILDNYPGYATIYPFRVINGKGTEVRPPATTVILIEPCILDFFILF